MWLSPVIEATVWEARIVGWLEDGNISISPAVDFLGTTQCGPAEIYDEKMSATVPHHSFKSSRVRDQAEHLLHTNKARPYLFCTYIVLNCNRNVQ
jgi:hypothetical protein